MRSTAVALLVVLAGLLSAARATAHPWMIRHQQSTCATCHADPSGGELLTAYGRMQEGQRLVTRWVAESEDDPAVPNMHPAWGLVEPPEWLLLGGAYRHGFLVKSGSGSTLWATFPMQADLWTQVLLGDFLAGGTLGVIRLPPGSPHGRAAQLTTEQGEGWNLVSRTHWLGVNVGAGWLLRAGRLNLPFGLRISEHTAWVREATRTDRESDQQHGVALAFGGANVRGELMGLAGNYQIAPDRYRERGYALYLETTVAPTTAIGLTSLSTWAAADLETLEQLATFRQAHGAFFRHAFGKPLVLMLELDTLLRSRRDLGYVGLVKLDLELVQGLHLMALGEVLDAGLPLRTDAGWRRGAAASGLGRPGWRGGAAVDWFFLPQLEARVDAMIDTDDTRLVLGQVRLYL